MVTCVALNECCRGLRAAGKEGRHACNGSPGAAKRLWQHIGAVRQGFPCGHGTADIAVQWARVAKGPSLIETEL